VDELAEGTSVLHYRIVRSIGSGGMGVVYEADDTRLGRRVALKFLPADLARDRPALERFQREARAASALNHPNICTIHAIEEAGGTPFIAMELLEGESLDRRIAERPLAWNALVDTATQIAEALDAAHRRGIIHRDIKPANLFLTTDGRAKILDFGIAKIGGSAAEQVETVAMNTVRQPLTGEGVTVGTVAYMSPEQARGEELDARSDLFSLGAVLYEMSTGRRAFEGNTSGVVFQKILDGSAPPEPRSLNPTLPPALEQVVVKALEKDRDLRYQTAGDLRADLKRLKRDASSGRLAFVPATTSGVAPAPISSGAVLLAEARRHKGLTSIASLLLIGVTAAAVYGLFSLTRPAPAPAASVDRSQKMTVTRLTTSGDVSGCGSISPDGRYVVYCDFGRHLRVRQVATGSTIDLGQVTGATTFSPDGDFIYVSDSDAENFKGVLSVLPALGGDARRVLTGISGAVGLSPNGKRLAFTRGDPATRELSVVIADLDGGNQKRLAAGHMDSTWFATLGVSWSPDGRRLAVVQGSVVGGYRLRPVLIEVDTGRVEALGSTTWVDLGRPVWLPDGSGVLFPARERSEGAFQFWIARYPGGEPARITNDARGFGDVSVSVTADGSTIATVPWDIVSNLFSTTPDASAPLEQWTSGVRIDGASGMAPAADGRLVFSSADGIDVGIFSVDAPGARPRRLTRDYAEVPSSPADGRFVAFQAIHEGRFRIWRVQRDGSDARVLSHGEDDIAPTVSPDGQWIYYEAADPKPALMRLPAEGGDAIRISERPVSVSDISADGRELLVVFKDAFGGRYAVMDAATGAVKTLLNLSGGRPRWSRLPGVIAYIDGKDGVDNVWERSVAGGSAKQLTTFTTGRIFSLEYAPDGKRLFLAKGQRTGDMVLIRNFR
jgi:eukaryotic-like serine/threonine-protein kinase